MGISEGKKGKEEVFEAVPRASCSLGRCSTTLSSLLERYNLLKFMQEEK
jgi:hypothetical protein